MGVDTQAAETSKARGTSGPPNLGKLSSQVVPHIINIYNCTSTPADFAVYAPNATFEDPLMRAHGVDQIKSAFYSLPKLFRESRIADYTVEEVESDPNCGEIKIDNTQHYNAFGKEFDMPSIITLKILDGKVVSHEDWWNKRPFWSRETVPLPLGGRAATGWRRMNMLFTHAIMGFGKDPK
eukprot:SM000194S04816  [mRNA]  locus=s194:61550:63539:- [translate_table: standard]